MTPEELQKARSRYFELALQEQYGKTPATTKELDQLESVIKNHVDKVHSTPRCIFPALDEHRNKDQTHTSTLG